MPRSTGKKNEPDRVSSRGLGLATRIGIDLVVATMLGAFGGRLLDRLLGTKPWLMIVGIFVGAAAGFMNIFRYLKTELKEDQKK